LSGSAAEPTPPPAEQAAEQMRDATERLRDRAWMVAPMTAAGAMTAAEPPDHESSEL
jgi:hypothetical protein